MTEHIPLLKKGALVAQDPPAFEQIDELDDTERDALRNEVLHKWRQPAALYFTVILCSVGAAVQGWDQTGSNGANLSWPVAFNVPDSPVVKNTPVPGVDYAKNSWIVGVVNAGPYLGSAFMSVSFLHEMLSPNVDVAVAGALTLSIIISDVVGPFSSPPSSAFYLSLVQQSPSHGHSFS